MVLARGFVFTFLVVVGCCAVAGAASPTRGIDGNGYHDDYLGISYPSKGLTADLVISGGAHRLMSGRTADGIELEILVNEIAGRAGEIDFVGIAKSQLAAQDPAPTLVAEGKQPQPWLISENVDAEGTRTNVGIGYHVRDDLVFIVRAWVPGETTANDRIQEALGRLEVDERSKVYLAAHVVSRGTNEDPGSAQNLARAAALYARSPEIGSYPLAIEVGEAAARAGKKTFSDVEEWQVYYVIGIAQLKSRQYEDAAFSWKRCVRLAESATELRSQLPGSHYNLAATYALLGRVDAAFDELETALELEAKAGDERLRELAKTDADLEKLRSDARWKQRFGSG